MSTTRAILSQDGYLNKLGDEAMSRFRIVVEGSDADHLKYPDAVTDIPQGILVDGCEEAESTAGYKAFGQCDDLPLKMNGSGSKGDWITPEDPSTDATGKGRAVPATAGAYRVIGRALEDWTDEQEIAIQSCFPFLAGAQHSNGQLSVPSFATDPTTPSANQMWVNSADDSLNIWIDGAKRTITYVLAMFAFLALALVMAQSAQAADVTPAKMISETTGQTGSVGASDNALFAGTVQAAGTITGGSTVICTDGFDAVGAVDIDYGSADVTDHTFTTDGTGDAEIVLPAGSISSSEITTALADQIAYITVTGADLAAAGTGTITIQLKDAAGNDLAAYALVRTWIGGADDFGPDALTDYSVSTGTSKEEVTANAEYIAVTDSSGTIVMAVDNGGAGTVYAWAEVGGRIVASGAVSLTAP